MSGRWIFQFDISNAFPSANLAVVKKALIRRFRFVLLYILQSSAEMTEMKNLRAEFEKYINNRQERKLFLSEEGQIYQAAKALTELILKLTTFRGIIPQGTPTAPFLFYLFLTESHIMEEIRFLIPDQYKCQISVYGDNFVISSQKPLPKEVKKSIFEVLSKHGLKINPHKTRNQDLRHGAPMITGLRIQNGRVFLPKKRIRKFRGIIHRALVSHQNPELLKKVKGIISSLKPIYGSEIPPQLKKDICQLLQLGL